MNKPEPYLQQLKRPLQFLLLLWVLQLLHSTLLPNMGQFGIYPRKVWGLRGIIMAPLIHGSWQHLISNSVPFLILAFALVSFYSRVAVKAFLMIYLLTGIGVWIFAGRAFHIGLSGVVYGMVTFIFWSGVFRRSAKSIALALAILVLYSGYFYGLVPKEGISWESHLIGALVGIFVAFWFRQNREPDERTEIVFEEEEKKPFLPRDIFD